MMAFREYLQKNSLLNIAKYVEASHSNGPGVRAVIWLQGCSIRCPDCVNHDFLPVTKRKVVHPNDLCQLIINSSQPIEGITISGGEPFDQLEGLDLLVRYICQEDLSIMIYTGYYFSKLQTIKHHLVDRVLANTDILIDGPFIQNQSDGLLGRGSNNQQIHFLSDRYDEPVFTDPNCWPHEEWILRNNETIVHSGIFN